LHRQWQRNRCTGYLAGEVTTIAVSSACWGRQVVACVMARMMLRRALMLRVRAGVCADRGNGPTRLVLARRQAGGQNQ
jgi:hypothetical protein